jgi:hypothetical protein
MLTKRQRQGSDEPMKDGETIKETGNRNAISTEYTIHAKTIATSDSDH